MYDPSWTEAVVIDGLTRLPRLQNLQLIFNRHAVFERSPGNLQLDRLSGLKRFSLSGNYIHHPPGIVRGLAGLIAKSPQLVHLEVKLGHMGIYPQPLTLHDVLNNVPEDRPLRLTHLALNRIWVCIDSFTLPHLRSLVSLDLRNLGASSTLTSESQERVYSTSDICAILKRENIYLKQVVVSDVGVFDYICSYSGLETLDLCSISFNNVEESNIFARQFYKSVLPHLVGSLQVLKIQPKREGQWCYNPEAVNQSVALSLCNKLRSLSIAFNSSSFIQSISHLDRVLHRYKDNLDDSVSSLINLSLSLPSLSELCIVIPSLGFGSDVIILNESESNAVMFYHNNVTELVERSVIGFSLQVGGSRLNSGSIPPDIWVGRKKMYQYQALDDGVGHGYKLTYHRLWDPYEYFDDNEAVMTTVVSP